MIKKITISLMTICTGISLLLVFYCFFQPKDSSNIALASSESLMIPYPTLQDYILTNGNTGTQYLYFCQPNSDDCQYMQNTVLKTLEAEQGSSLSEIFTYVDVTELETTLTINRLKDDWGIKSYPAFVAINNNNGEITVKNYIEWNNEDPISARELKQWMMVNNIWAGLFEEKDNNVLMPR